MDHDSARAVHRAVRRAARSSHAPLLLAVSGGLDSTALLVAMARAAGASVAAVATFDHGSGRSASAAAAHVSRLAGALGFPVVVGHASAARRTGHGQEAAWRAARHAFLRDAAAATGAAIVTAHTRDDQVETVLMRILRGSGARGLAGLEAASPILRPLLGLPRAALRSYLLDAGVAWLDDPSNASPAHLRNRVRRELLPALRLADASIDDALLATGHVAARWRAEVDDVVATCLQPVTGRNVLDVASAELAGYDRDSLAMLWGALAARVGLALDRRGTHRLATFTTGTPVAGLVPLSGGWCLEARPGVYRLRRSDPAPAAPATLPEVGEVEWGRFRFRVDDGGFRARQAYWVASFPADGPVRVRSWRAGDRLAPAAGQPRRRVARYLSDVGVRGTDRAGWPVVVLDDGREGDVVWIPGVRRADAATARSGRPVRHYVCERIAP